MRVPPLAFAGTLATAVLAAAPVAAAPQILGVVASIAPVEMSCTVDTCTAQLSAFCLQRERDVPAEHAAYRAADPGAFTLLARRADGTTIEVPFDGRPGECAGLRW